MGLFSRRPSPVVLHPSVERIVYVRGPQEAALERLADYSTLWSPKRATTEHVELAQAGPWTAIRLPAAVHPWQLHNLAMWMIDTPGADGRVIAWSAASTQYPAYWLVPDPEIGDCLCGWDADGIGRTVYVPTNDVVVGDPVPADRGLALPSGFEHWQVAELALDDPGGDLNPDNVQTVASRRALRDRHTLGGLG